MASVEGKLRGSASLGSKGAPTLAGYALVGGWEGELEGSASRQQA